MPTSADDYEKWGLVFLLALTLECWIEGLVTDAEFRTWMFHAIAALAAAAALYRRHTLPVVLAGAVSIIAFLNDLELLVSAELPLRYLAPSLLLLVGAGLLFFGMSQTSHRSPVATPARGPLAPRTRETAGKMVDAAGAIAGMPNIRNDLRESKSDPAWPPFLLGGGTICVLYIMLSAKWIRIDAFFGLTKRSLDFNDLREVYDSIGVKYFARNFYFEWGFILPYLAALLGAVSLIGWLTKRFRVDSPFLYGVLAIESIALIIHTAAVLGINHATEEPVVLAGPWLGSLGVAAIMAGTWLAESRS
jgi:hypothetical protein